MYESCEHESLDGFFDIFTPIIHPFVKATSNVSNLVTKTMKPLANISRKIVAPVRKIAPSVTIGGHKYDTGGSRLVSKLAVAAPLAATGALIPAAGMAAGSSLKSGKFSATKNIKAGEVGAGVATGAALIAAAALAATTATATTAASTAAKSAIPEGASFAPGTDLSMVPGASGMTSVPSFAPGTDLSSYVKDADMLSSLFGSPSKGLGGSKPGDQGQGQGQSPGLAGIFTPTNVLMLVGLTALTGAAVLIFKKPKGAKAA